MPRGKHSSGQATVRAPIHKWPSDQQTSGQPTSVTPPPSLVHAQRYPPLRQSPFWAVRQIRFKRSHAPVARHLDRIVVIFTCHRPACLQTIANNSLPATSSLQHFCFTYTIATHDHHAGPGGATAPHSECTRRSQAGTKQPERHLASKGDWGQVDAAPISHVRCAVAGGVGSHTRLPKLERATLWPQERRCPPPLTHTHTHMPPYASVQHAPALWPDTATQPGMLWAKGGGHVTMCRCAGSDVAAYQPCPPRLAFSPQTTARNTSNQLHPTALVAGPGVLPPT